MPNIKNIVYAFLLIVLLLPISGCFDYEVVLELKKDGSGQLAIDLKVPEHWGGQDQLPRMNSIVLPAPKRTAQIDHGRMVLHEVADFRFMDELAVRRVHIKIDTADKGIIGITNYTYRMILTLKPYEGDLPDRLLMPGRELETREVAKPKELDPAQERARKLMARTLRGHYITLHLKLPGSVKEARPIVVGSQVIKPRVEGDDKNVVIYWIPLSELAGQKVRHNLKFSLDFSADLKFRAEEHEATQSRYPTQADEKLAENMNKKK